MFDSAALRADILADFDEVQAMSCDVESIWADFRASKWRAYQREWARAKRARLAKYHPRFCLCCGKVLPKQTTGRARNWCGESCRCRVRRERGMIDDDWNELEGIALSLINAGPCTCCENEGQDCDLSSDTISFGHRLAALIRRNRYKKRDVTGNASIQIVGE